MYTSDRSTIETSAWLTLLRAPMLSAVNLRRLVLRAGSAAAALTQIEALRHEVAISAETLAWLRAPDIMRIDADLQWLTSTDHHLLTWSDIDFPDLLREIGAAPAALFVVGDPSLLWRPQIAIVGARSATAGGLANARSFARRLSQAGFVITSGLADGIDGAAHTATLDAQGSTIAVMGTGADQVYPRKHRELAARIAANGGALVSEFNLGTTARSESFPRRNRIIAGLSLGTLVVEAGLQSGSLITARLAGEQGREVFALPGSIHNPLARGCHQLIRQGARLIETSDELIADLSNLAQTLADRLRQHLTQPASITVAVDARSASIPRDADYLRVLDALGHDPTSVDELAQRSALSIAALSSMLLVLELEGVVASAGGGRYQRC